jgi:hypothetical protein
MKCQERCGTYGDADLSDAARTEEERSVSTEQSVAQRQVRRSIAGTAEDDQVAA